MDPSPIDGAASLSVFCGSYSDHRGSSRAYARQILRATLRCQGTDLTAAEVGPPTATTDWCNVSLSYAKSAIAIAVAWGCDVGVDVEDRSRRPSALVEHAAFSHREVESIARYTGAKRDASWYTWTRKEAALKCVGRGIDCDLRTIPTTSELILTGARGLARIHLVSLLLTDVVVSVATTRALEWRPVARDGWEQVERDLRRINARVPPRMHRFVGNCRAH